MDSTILKTYSKKLIINSESENDFGSRNLEMSQNMYFKGLKRI